MRTDTISQRPSDAPQAPFPVGYFAVPPAGTNDPYESERDGMIEDALSLATGAVGRDPVVAAIRSRMEALVTRLRELTEDGTLTRESDKQLWFEIDSEAGALSIKSAEAVARAWLWDRGSIPLDRQALIDHYNR